MCRMAQETALFTCVSIMIKNTSEYKKDHIFELQKKIRRHD